MRPLLVMLAACCCLAGQPLQVSGNGRFLQTSDGKPFFWLGDTAWLLFQRLNQADTLHYLDDRHRKGFNVVQAVILHPSHDTNAHGAAALAGGDPARPLVTAGYEYWDHIEWVIDRAAERGITIGLLPCWGFVVNSGRVNEQNVEGYARFLAERYRNKPNIVWITGGDTRGDRKTEVWRAMGRTLKQADAGHLVTYHPFGRTQSSTWFHTEAWLDFNMFQSCHRRYDQDDTPGAKREDNWRYVQEDYARRPVKPTLDGEPSYENTPQGLHDPAQPRWTAADVRRYAWWAVLAGASGHTYGESSVMQIYQAGRKTSYGALREWRETLDAPGAGQMQHVKRLMLSRPYFERVPDQTLIAGGNGTRHDYIVAARGSGYAFAYTWTGRPISLRLGAIEGRRVRASWYDPRTGEFRTIGVFANSGIREFDPPGEPGTGNDWVLVLDGVTGPRAGRKETNP